MFAGCLLFMVVRCLVFVVVSLVVDCLLIVSVLCFCFLCVVYGLWLLLCGCSLLADCCLLCVVC